jgi:hypothetical protein
MYSHCSTPPNKRKYVKEIGKVLLQDYRKKKFYQPEEVKQAHQKSTGYNNVDYSCWA